jgi:DNA-directed RNA polymerase specialized sigma subunit
MKKEKKKEVVVKKANNTFMTQQEVAEAMGVDRGYISLVETKAKARFKEELAKRGYKMEDFLGGMA